MSEPTILVVDDEKNVLSAVRRCLRNLDVAVETAENAYDALAVIRRSYGGVAVVIADQKMPGMTGLELLQRIRDASPRTVRVLFTGYAEMDLVIRAINEGEVFRFVKKPWDDVELQGVVLCALQHHRLLVENERLTDEVTRQQEDLEELERMNPGLTRLPPKDSTGAFIIEPPSDQSSAW